MLFQKNAINTSHNRNAWFDNAKAFLILTVVVGHLAEILLSTVSYKNEPPLWLEALMETIYVFHMPVFMVISGRFSKKRIDQGNWIATFNKLLIPYLLAQTMMMLIYSLTGYSKASDMAYFKPGFGLWYLFALTIYQFLTPAIIRCFRKRWLLFPISIAVAFALTYQELAFLGSFQRVFSFFPFFIFGYLTAEHNFDWCKKMGFRIFSLLCFIGLIALVIRFNKIVEIPLLSGKRVYAQYQKLYGYEEYQLFILMVLRYLAGFLFFPFVMGISPQKNWLFTKLGTHSSYVYVLHLYITVALTALGKNHHAWDFCKNDLWAVLFCAVGIPLCFLMVSSPVKKWTKWLIAPSFDLKRITQKILDSQE